MGAVSGGGDAVVSGGVGTGDGIGEGMVKTWRVLNVYP